MITVFDLRKNAQPAIITNIRAFYKEEVNIISLGDKIIKKCIGCWSCWLKTPGKCIMQDDLEQSYEKYVNSDKAIVLIDTAQGFINHHAKAFLDRSIPHYLPYIVLIDKECQHTKRYNKYPDLVFYFDTEGLTKLEEQVIEDYLYRTAYQHKSKGFRLTYTDHLAINELHHRAPKNRQLEMTAHDTKMKLIIYNGSPRITNSNSSIILNQVKDQLYNQVEIRDLKETKQWPKWSKSFLNEEHILFFMPLYVHAMPSHVMAFIETLNPSNGSISFFVQSGFPESSQSFFLEAYFEQLSIRLNRTYGGTAIKGGMEGLQMRSSSAQAKMIQPLVDAIDYLSIHKMFNKDHLIKLSNPIHLNVMTRLLFWLIGRKMTDYFWNSKLKSNGALDQALNRPYSLE